MYFSCTLLCICVRYGDFRYVHKCTDLSNAQRTVNAEMYISLMETRINFGNTNDLFVFNIVCGIESDWAQLCKSLKGPFLLYEIGSKSV